ncbi:MAG: glycosyltransferase family 2 protein [Planctomycetes bacterium]|nr:glycosyltransferase family 2 protein [Planctomycetota bacterium]
MTGPTSLLHAPAETARPVVDLTAGIVNYRSLGLLEQCLATWATATEGLRAELTVLENGTGEAVGPVVRRFAPGARVRVRERSIAFTAAVNEAFAGARGRHFVLLNPDTLLRRQSLTRLVHHLDEHPDVGVVGPRVWDDPEHRSLQRSFRRFPGLATAFCHRYSLLARLWPQNPWTRAYLRLDDGGDGARDADWVSGCCLAVRGELFQRLGGLDTGYPMFCEDVDLCRRARGLGYRVVYEPAAEIVHLVGGSRRRAPLRSEWLRHRSIGHYVWKFHRHGNPWTWLLLAGVWTRFLLRALLAGRTR